MAISTASKDNFVIHSASTYKVDPGFGWSVMIASRYVEHASTLRRGNKQNEPKEDMD